MRLSEFDYHLPQDLIAQEPLAERSASRMLVLFRKEQRWEDRMFSDLPSYLRPGDCLVLNDSKVFPSRLYGHRAGATGQVEVLLLRPISEDGKTWQALVHPGRKMRSGEALQFDSGLEALIIGRGSYGERVIRFRYDGDLYEKIDKIGHVPLPPYIRRPDEPQDRERYQTVFARERGSVAAPTAGLHFTPEVLKACRAAGAEIAFVTLHVGLGTFQPIHEEEFEHHRLHSEWFEITSDNAAKITAASRRVAAGTTSVRAIETAYQDGSVVSMRGETTLFIYPGFSFKATGAMLTNFHLPRTSLLLLVCAFGGKELVLAAYRHAVEHKYRFYSYGDCMLII